jgi:4-amino-4-deoxy-L-arabinose transferase-like glycosyltransferase
MIKKFFKNYWPLLLIAAVAGFIFIRHLGRDLLHDWDECIYAQNAKEMRLTGNFLTNSWNGYPHLEKPPLYTWILQIPITFGGNEFALRIFTVVACLTLIALMFVFCKKYLSERIAVLSTLILLSSETLVIHTRGVNTDLGFTLLIFTGFWLWWLSFKKYQFSYLAGLFFGLAVMIKGIGVLPFLAALFVSIFLNFRKEKLQNYGRMSAAFIVVIAPWHILAYTKYGYEFFRVYFLENIIRRSSYPIEFHNERWYFYFVLLYNELKPWIGFAFVLPVAYLWNLRKYASLKKISQELKNKELIFTIILLIGIPLASITRVQTRLAWYVLPVYPFIAIYLAYNIESLFKSSKLERLAIGVIFFVALGDLQLLVRENGLFESRRVVSPRDEIVIKASQYPQKELHYLVPFGARRSRQILPPEEQIESTWRSGGHPCAIYYSGKKVYYSYFVDEFIREIATSHGLFLVPNEDIEDIQVTQDSRLKALYKNSEFTLFEKNK